MLWILTSYIALQVYGAILYEDINVQTINCGRILDKQRGYYGADFFEMNVEIYLVR